jgi:hypothetical protein
VSLTVFIGLVTLAPLAGGAIIFALGLARRAWWRATLAIAALAALVPAVGLPFVAPELASGYPIVIRPFGVGAGFTAYIAPTYRVDALALYAALGVAFLVVPFLLWQAFFQYPAVEPAPDELEVTAPEATADEATEGTEADEEADGTPAEPDGGPVLARPEPAWRRALRPDLMASTPLVRALGLALALETAALTLALADGIVLLGVAWIALAVLAWGLGEVASEPGIIDRPGLIAPALGPLLWLVVILIPAAAAQAPRLIALTGRTALNSIACILLAVALAVAGGAYPALAWVRRRAALAEPVGLTALVLAALPAALYVALRTYGVAVDATDRWPLLGIGVQTTNGGPAPLTAGIAYALLGAATVVVCGLLALGRRDGRTLVALLAAAQLGWGLMSVGVGRPVSALGAVLLLLTGTLGLGAMLGALVAGGALASGPEEVDEPEAFGPRVAGAAARPVALAAWCVGAASLVGAPLLAGFVPRQLASGGALQVAGLDIPLLGLCWFGDALLVLALLRATAPALADRQPADATTNGRRVAVGPRDLPAALFAAMALAQGIVPALALSSVAAAATGTLLWPGTLDGSFRTDVAGYTLASGQWTSVLAWIAVAVVAVAFYLAQPSAGRVLVPVYRAGQPGESRETEPAEGPPTDDAATEGTELTLAEPTAAWGELAGVFDSNWTLPGNAWLLARIDDEDGEGGPDEEEDEPAAEAGVTITAGGEEASHGDE